MSPFGFPGISKVCIFPISPSMYIGEIFTLEDQRFSNTISQYLRSKWSDYFD